MSILRRRPVVQELISRGAEMEANIDDMRLGTNSQEDHVLLLCEFFIACQENHLRIKLEKCEFMKEEMEYLGFDVGYGWWKPAASNTYDFMKSPDPKIIVAADAKKPTETVAARAFSLAESNFWLRNLKIRDYEALFARTIEDTNHPHLFNHDTPLGTAPKSRKRSITSQKATIWPFFAIFPSENTFYLVPRGCGSIKGVPWNHLTISKT